MSFLDPFYTVEFSKSDNVCFRQSQPLLTSPLIPIRSIASSVDYILSPQYALQPFDRSVPKLMLSVTR